MPQESAPNDSESARKERAERLRRQIEEIKERAGAPVPKPDLENPREMIDRLTHTPNKPEPSKD